MREKLMKKAQNLPMAPGVYQMLDKNGTVIYVGKAKQLKNRVSSYFHGAHDIKTTAMTDKICDFEVILAASEFEALVLENSLIKHHMPKYNLLLRDDKGYPFIRIDLRERYPRFTISPKIKDDGAKYFGPFGGRKLSRDAIDMISKALKLPTCNRKFPRDIGRQRPCLNHHMGACRGYCQKGVTEEEYDGSIAEAVSIFDGKISDVVSKLRREMEEAADNLQFEAAAEKRDRIRKLTSLETKQRVVSNAFVDLDAVGFYRGVAKSCFVVLHYIEGSLLFKDFEVFDTPFEDDSETLSGLVRQFYMMRESIPKKILLPVDIPDGGLLERLFTERSGKKITVYAPKRGEMIKLIEAANNNARDEAVRATTQEERTSKTLEWLQKSLGLAVLPVRIEAYDISNTGSDNIVSGMTVFQSGKPLKKDYRMFRIKTAETQDDYKSVYETVSRRIKRCLEGDEKFTKLPDLMLIDGGQGQVRAAEKALSEQGVDIPVFGMVKERHRTDALINSAGERIGIRANPAVFALIGRIQEETHRFAISYHRKLRSKSGYASELDGIPGVGEKRKKALLRAFKSLKAIKSAGISELAEVVPKNTAKAIFDHFHTE